MASAYYSEVEIERAWKTGIVASMGSQRVLLAAKFDRTTNSGTVVVKSDSVSAFR
jgi:hypothetical protein